MPSRQRRVTLPIGLLGAGLVIFLGVMAFLIASSLTRRVAPTFAATAEVRGVLEPGVVDTLTVDASDPDRWRYVDLRRGAILPPGQPRDWQLAVRLFHVVAAERAANLREVAFEQVSRTPDTGYVATRFAGDTSNAAIGKWYRYGMLTHLLETKHDVYVLKGSDGRAAKVQILSYYCPGMKPGCLTIRYAWLEEGTR